MAASGRAYRLLTLGKASRLHRFNNGCNSEAHELNHQLEHTAEAGLLSATVINAGSWLLPAILVGAAAFLLPRRFDGDRIRTLLDVLSGRDAGAGSTH
jgi:hypothetical protein